MVTVGAPWQALPTNGSARSEPGKHMERRRGESEIGSDLVDRPSPDKPRLDRLSASAVASTGQS